MKLEVMAVAEHIGVPVERWPGQCYAVAYAMVQHKLVEGQPVYGHYLGVIHPKSMFAGKPLVSHGWVRTPAGGVCDPTRWVFEQAEPYIYTAAETGREYDEGGNLFRLLRERPAPKRSKKDEVNEVPVWAREVFATLLGRKDLTAVSNEDALWIANLSLLTLNTHAGPIYQALAEMDLSAFIPLDNRFKVLGKG